MSFAELVAATAFSFLRGAAQPSDMVAEAVRLGHDAIGIADRNTVAGVVRAYSALKKANEELAEEKLPPLDFRLLVGARLVFADGTPDVVAYPATRAGWGRLTRLLTQGNLRAEKGGCILWLNDLLGFADEQMLIVLPESSYDADAVTAYRGENVVPRGEPDNVVQLPIRPAKPASVRAEPVEALLFLSQRREERTALRQAQRERGGVLAQTLAALATAAPGRVWLGASPRHDGRDRRRLARLAQAARHAGVPLLATNEAMYATEDDRPLHDVMTCIRLGTPIHRAGRALAPNAEAHLKSADEMAQLFADWPEALAEPMPLAERVQFTLEQLSYEYPHEPVPAGWEPQSWLEKLVRDGAAERYPEGVPAAMTALIDEELKIIAQANYAYYFLTVHDVVRFARGKGILCQGRGSAANSAVCYLLGVTSVDPTKYNLLFSRFISVERREPPDIDVDFEHERREEVMQYIYDRYGRHRAGIVATVIHYRPRSAVREVGKALGFSEDVTARLAATIWGSFASRMEDKRFAESGFDIDNPDVARLRMVVDKLLQFPRHLSQHVGGYVLTEGRLDEMVPIHNGAMDKRTFIEWDKDDIDALKLMKVDVLALGMLTCIWKAFGLIETHLGKQYLLETVPDDQPDVYAMLCAGDSVGVFQVESRAQMNMLPRLRPEKLYDLVIQVAIVRPGPIAGDMVHPYLRRKQGKETPEYPSPAPEHGPADELRRVLGKTLGVPLFQEQAMQLAITAASFTPSEANQLRRAMATFRNLGGMENFEQKMVGGMVARGYDRAFAERCYKQIEGFGSYGFPESHALSFAKLVYISSYLKCRYPAVFCAAILNSQPMGFYAPAQLVKDAENHGVEVRAIDVNASGWDNGLEVVAKPLPLGGGVGDGACLTETSIRGPQPNPFPEGEGLRKFAVRLGLRQIDGFQQEWAEPLVAARDTAPFASVEDLARRANLPPRALRLLADADAFRSLGLDRRAALWDARRTPQGELPLFAATDARELSDEGERALPVMPLAEQVATDYQTTRLSLKGHPMGFLRPLFRAERVASAAGINGMKDGTRAAMAGVVLVRQRPGKGNAIFVTLEDETGVVNLVLWARTFEAYRRQVMASRLMLAHGIVQRSEEGVIHLMTERVVDRSVELARLTRHGIVEQELSRADTFKHPIHRTGHPRDVRILPGSRDFH